ncbi:hypothetical protein GCM10020229_82000 [Kitasatospora albolonga]|uniref:LysR family transcriptional regulator n=1 Tax=Kitasatospora albolonga TaxID=68173 RepID=UPI0031EEB663
MIDARRLRTLRAVADHRTVTAAAAALYLTPSAVSQQLAALEQETGHHLLAREGRGVRLTAAGEILLLHADLVLAQLERAEADLAAYQQGAAGEVTVAAFATGIALVLAPAIADLATAAPGVRLRVLDAEGDASLPMVLDGRADIAPSIKYWSTEPVGCTPRHSNQTPPFPRLYHCCPGTSLYARGRRLDTPLKTNFGWTSSLRPFPRRSPLCLLVSNWRHDPARPFHTPYVPGPPHSPSH